jgi:hypothetical protein
MTRKKSLPIAGKSLMPEILPNPSQARNFSGATARERVRARLRQLSENAAAFAAAAGLAACSDSHGGEQLSAGASGIGTAAVGGIASQAGHGAAGAGAAASGGSGVGAAARGGVGGAGKPAIGGPAGYGVVDPLPPPAYVCGMLKITTASATWQPGQGVVLSFQVSTSYGVTLSSASVPAGVMASVTSASSAYAVKLASGGTWPATTRVTLNFTCTGGGGTPTTAQASVWLDTSHPASSGSVTVSTSAIGDVDAGT